MKRAGSVMAVVGLVLVLAAGAWSLWAVPKLVKFPLNTDLQLQYTGRFVTYVDAHTGLPLAQPVSVALTVNRHIKALGSESTSGVAAVEEQLTVIQGGTTTNETNVYALDRRAMDDVASSHAYTFAPGNPAPVTGSFYITLPMKLGPNTPMAIWKPETATTYPLRPLAAGSQPATLDGLRVDWFSAVLKLTPVAPYERASLAARGLPMSVPPSTVETEMTAAGISVPKLEGALVPKLTATQLSAVLAVLKTPVALHYYAFGSGLVAAEPRTGTIVALKNVIDGIAVAPSTTGMQTLITVMEAHPTVKGVTQALAVLHRLAAAPPQPVYEMQYTQTPAAITTMVNTANSQISQIRTVTDTLPIGAAVLGVLVLLAGFVLRRRHAGHGGTPVPSVKPVSPPAEHERRQVA